MRILLLFSIVLLGAGAAHADSTRDALTEIAKCADITDGSERLKCFDAAVSRAKSALAAPAEKPSERSLLEWFGFGRPSTPLTKPEDFGKSVQEPASREISEPREITEITAKVLEFAKTLRGMSVFILDNGQVWRQLDADGTEVVEPAPGTKITIERGVLGSYNLTIEGRNAMIKVSRLK